MLAITCAKTQTQTTAAQLQNSFPQSMMIIPYTYLWFLASGWVAWWRLGRAI
jgi:hypothetical protein